MMSRLAFIAGIAASIAFVASRVPAGDARPATVQTVTVPSTGPIVESASTWATRYVVAPTGNEVRYRVREQLVGFDLPNDAVGKSATVSGAIAFDADGQPISSESRFAANASAFVSDKDRRDNYVRARLLNAEQFPEIVLVPTALRGATLPIGNGSRTFDLLADLTVRGVTRPTVWRVTAQVDADRVSGAATTRFVFDDFQMEKPRVRSVLSVADTIALEYDFNLLRESTSSAP